MPKAYSSFVYFILESNENISFYSTEPAKIGQVNRTVTLYCTPELEPEVKNSLDHFIKRDAQLLITNREIILDL